jgi:hypothetical protein
MIKVTFSLKNRSIIRGMSGLICACKDCGLLSYRTGERKGCPCLTVPLYPALAG